MKFLVKTLHNLEPILANELKELGAKNIRKIKRAVACEGDLKLLYQINYCARTALRVLVPIYEFQAKGEKDLYDQIKKFDWSEYLDVHQTFAISNSVFSDLFRHSKFATLKMKDAMADQFRDKYGRRPSVDPKSPEVQFDLHGWKDRFTVSLDSSGEPLNQRGYREQGHQAPLNEVLAAGMVQLAKWDHKQPLLDPMCGTGTIIIEAAMLANNMPAQYLRKQFGFRGWKNFNPMIWNKVKIEADGQMRNKAISISGGDIDPKAVSIAKKSLRKLGLKQSINIREVAFEKHRPGTPDGMIITNPPYGERLGAEDDILGFYKTISDLFKQNFSGFDAWVLSSNFEALKHLKLSPSRKIPLLNGKLECSFQEYKLYRGAKPDA